MTDAPEAPAPAFRGAADREAAEQARRAAAPVAADVEAIGALAPETRRALYALLVSLADNKYVLGRRYAEWCTGAPMLESAVAAAAMAQDELGHARSFYPLLRGFPEASESATMEERGWQSRPTSAMACLDAPFQAWSDFAAANFVVDTALTVLFEAATDSTYEPLRQRARKIVQEEQAHWSHAAGWLRRLARDERGRGPLRASLVRLLADALTWYGRPDDAVLGQLVGAGVLAAGPEQLRERLRERLRPLIEAAGLAADLPPTADSSMGAPVGDRPPADGLPWARWDPAARRLRPGA